jgi:hypothetical protein
MEDGWFTDELLGEPYRDPVMAEDGFIYERTFIEEWFNKGGNKSPKTLLPIGVSLFYPFEYYQARDAWAKGKGLPEMKKPFKYGLIDRVDPPRQTPLRRILPPSLLPRPIQPVSINYYSSDDEDSYIEYMEYIDDYVYQPHNSNEFPPLPQPSPPTNPPIVRAANRPLNPSRVNRPN